MNVATLEALEQDIERIGALEAGAQLPHDALRLVEQLLVALERGEVRAARRDADGRWHAVPWVKRGILLGFRVGQMVEMSVALTGALSSFTFFDKSTFPPRSFRADNGVRIVPGGSAVRRGAYLAPGVICMPPMYVNVGAWVGEGSMIDSHALVGSCAQVGARVHVSAAAQLGGVLEPVNASPVIVEDEALVGGNVGIYEGTIVRTRAVIGAGVVLTRATPVYDLVREIVYRGSAENPLEIPAGAVVVPGARMVRGEWAEREGLSIQTPVVVKYRDDRTDTATALEQWLR
jgi:2,3,4,5-tetrahydropyridine-2-carboxylate N-succinyltransferase